jgi:hypothetical protein
MNTNFKSQFGKRQNSTLRPWKIPKQTGIVVPNKTSSETT